MNKFSLKSKYLAAILLGSISLVPVYAHDDAITSAAIKSTRDDSFDQKIAALTNEQSSLETRTSKLLLLLANEREKILDEEKRQALADLDMWEEDPSLMTGLGLKESLTKAYAQAERHGLDVVRLKKLLETSRNLVRGHEYHQSCGTPSTTLGQMANGISDSSVIAANIMEYYKLVDHEDERLACVSARRLTTYRAMYNSFLRALLTEESQKVDPNGLTDAGFEESKKGFEDFARSMLTIQGIESDALVAEAKAMAEDQESAMLVFEMVPVVGEMLDVYKLATGESVLGSKLTKMDTAMTAGFLFTPKILTIWIRRNPAGVAALKTKLTSFQWGYMDDSFLQKAATNSASAMGNSLKSMRKWADDSLKQLDEVASKNPQGNTVNARKVKQVPGQAPKAAIRESLESGGLIRVAKGDYFRMADEANMLPEQVLALSENAVKRHEVYIVRHLSEVALDGYRKAYRAATQGAAFMARIATKPMRVKPKSSNYPILSAGIPIDQGLSKTNELLEKAIEAGDDTLITKYTNDIAEKNMFMNGGVEEITDALGNVTTKTHAPLVAPPGATAEEMVNYPFRRTIAQYEGQEVLWKTVNGKKVLGISQNGKLLDPISGATYSLDGVQTVEVLSDTANIKILPDFDMMGVFSKALGMDWTWDAAGNFVDRVMTGTLGLVDRVSLDALTAINTSVKGFMKVLGDVVHHGPAHFFKAPPDYPLDVFLKDGSYIKIMRGPESNPDQHLKAFYHYLKREGYEVPAPPVEWGWGAYDAFRGFLGTGS